MQYNSVLQQSQQLTQELDSSVGLSISLLKQNHRRLNKKAENSNSAVFLPYQILRTMPNPNFDSSAHPEFA